MFACRQSTPSNMTVPSYGTSPEIARRVDVFPAPFGPISATTSPHLHVDVDAPHRQHRSVRHFELRGSRARISPTSRDAEVRVDDALVLEHRGGVAHGDEVAELEHRDPVAEPRDEVELVVDDEQ